MSVLLTLRFAADPSKLEAIAAADPDRLRRIVDRAREHGVRSHHFYGTGDELLVLDEWESEEGFQRFFSSDPDIPALMKEAGVDAEPEVRFWRRLETHDDVEAPAPA